MPKRLGGILGCKDKTSSWHLIDVVLGWLDLARVLSRFGSLLVWVAGCHHDVTR